MDTTGDFWSYGRFGTLSSALKMARDIRRKFHGRYIVIRRTGGFEVFDDRGYLPGYHIVGMVPNTAVTRWFLAHPNEIPGWAYAKPKGK